MEPMKILFICGPWWSLEFCDYAYFFFFSIFLIFFSTCVLIQRVWEFLFLDCLNCKIITFCAVVKFYQIL
jgi:hypothetical protein